MIKTYSELIHLPTFEERFDYLKLGGSVGKETFGFERYLNQALYTSTEWKSIRREVLLRDNGCDLAFPGYEILVYPTIHHIVPITIEDIEEGRDCVFDLNNLICTSPITHRAIHFARESLLRQLPKERTKGDMCPWKTVS